MFEVGVSAPDSGKIIIASSSYFFDCILEHFLDDEGVGNHGFNCGMVPWQTG